MSTPPSKFLHILLWIEGVLALAFGMIGVTKLTTSEADIIQQSGELVEKYGVGLIRFIGIAEVLGALGLILPAALRILPILTPLASLGLAIIMGLATALHASKGEPIVTQVVFLLLTLFVVWGRFSKAPISAR
ncbi:MAG: DoxX family protein [Bacteroidetes bacterium]|nr:DoxX family protein [Bacteroidota bacterium]